MHRNKANMGQQSNQAKTCAISSLCYKSEYSLCSILNARLPGKHCQLHQLTPRSLFVLSRLEGETQSNTSKMKNNKCCALLTFPRCAGGIPENDKFHTDNAAFGILLRF